MPASDASDRSAIAHHVVETIREAGALALKSFKTPFKSWVKHGNSPVTETDLAVDALLKERLHRDGFGWLSEETEDDPARLSANRVWIVDPIDGTRAFIAPSIIEPCAIEFPDSTISGASGPSPRVSSACAIAFARVSISP